MRALSILAAILFLPAALTLTACERDEPAAPPPPPTTTIGANSSAPAGGGRRVETREVEVEVVHPVVVDPRPHVVIEAPAPPHVEVHAPTPPHVEVHAPTPPHVEVH